jgi:DNA-binding response OmpR family regulator
VIDLEGRTVTTSGQVIRLPRLGFDLCAYLAAHPGAVRTRVQIMDAIGIPADVSDRAVDSHVARARKAGVVQIATAAAVGYYWQD